MTNRPYLPVAPSLSVVAVFMLIALLAGPVAAQSGRRGPKSSVPAPTPAPQDEPEEKKPDAETRADLSFVVGIDRGSMFSDLPNYFYDSVLRACGERLDDSPSVKVTIANHEMTRADAMKQAKAETESHIVWLQLRFDTATGQSGNDLREIYIEYWVYAPTTAKVVTNGKTYQKAFRTGGIITMPVPGGGTNATLTEQMLKQAARDAAERILSNMNTSSRKVPGV
jgi:hypothetical protein